jgi:hypothetical protein
MFSLHVPLLLPRGHSFFDDGRHSVPFVSGKFTATVHKNAPSSVAHENAPLFLSIAGFPTQDDAENFWPKLRPSLLWATLKGQHSATIPEHGVIRTGSGMFDGSLLTVFPTGKANPYHMSGSVEEQLHISVLVNYLNEGITRGLSTKLQANPELALALELFCEFQFAGTHNSQFVMLFTALEVLEKKHPKKRGPTIARVKDAFSRIGHPNPKSVGKKLDKLYKDRNSLIHDATPVTSAQVSELAEIVRGTLTAMLS